MKRVLIGVLSLGALLLATMALPPAATEATHPATPRPLINCADVTADGSAAVGDIGTVVSVYGNSSPDYSAVVGGYQPLYDLIADGAIAIGDIGSAVADFGHTCSVEAPQDTQIARASLWGAGLTAGLAMSCTSGNPSPPKTLTPANETTLNGQGYFRGSSDVSGQGIHFVKYANWDGTFDPCRPEGLVYDGQGGKLVAQLYVTDGNVIGWGDYEATSFPPGASPDNIDLEGDATGPQCSPACSWAGPYDGWHLHYYLCTVAIGTSKALTRPGDFFNPGVDDGYPTDIRTDAECASFASSYGHPGNYNFSLNVGWMGHLWNQKLNPNLTTLDLGGNGRFADCYPEDAGGGQHWNGFNCPQ